MSLVDSSASVAPSQRSSGERSRLGLWELAHPSRNDSSTHAASLLNGNRYFILCYPHCICHGFTCNESSCPQNESKSLATNRCIPKKRQQGLEN
jgi:hypothetical protein